jgi:triosephosphate isomerase
MCTTRGEAVELAKGIAAAFTASDQVDAAVCPPAVYLEAVAQTLQGSAVGLGGQNMYFKPFGAFTGEVNGEMLLDVGCQFVILGHSERRQHFGETDQLINQKVLRALELGLKPIVCLGEKLEQRKAGQTTEVVGGQFAGSLADLTAEQMQQVVIAYEPVWAIGTGVNAEPHEAEAVHADLRKMLESRYNSQVASTVRIQYGGSVKPNNAAALLKQPNIDGALVGGASLEVKSFLDIIAATGA